MLLPCALIWLLFTKTIYLVTVIVYYQLYQQHREQSTNNISAIRRKREIIKQQMMDQPDVMGTSDMQDDDLFHKPSSLPSDKVHSDELGSNRNASDEESDVGFINKTRSFPDLSKSTHAQQQQALAIKEMKLKKREEAIQQKEFHLQRQNEAMIRGGYPRVYSREQPIYTGTAAGYNWSGAMAYSGQQSSQGPPNTTFIYHPNEQQWSRPHGKHHHNIEHY